MSKNYITGAYNSFKKPIIKLNVSSELDNKKMNGKTIKRIVTSIVHLKSSYFRLESHKFNKAAIEINIVNNLSDIAGEWYGLTNNYIMVDYANGSFNRWAIPIENLAKLLADFDSEECIKFFLICFIYEIFVIWKLIVQKAQYITKDNLSETLMHYFSHKDCGCIFDETKCQENIWMKIDSPTICNHCQQNFSNEFIINSTFFKNINEELCFNIDPNFDIFKLFKRMKKKYWYVILFVSLIVIPVVINIISTVLTNILYHFYNH